MDTLEKLKALDQSDSEPGPLPKEVDIINAEEKLGVKFPPSYKKFQLKYSNVSFGHLEMYTLIEEGGYLDLINNVREARQFHGLDDHLLPFVQEQDGEYFCFNLKSNPSEYEVVYWSHNGTTEEKWDNFLDWIEKCWISEGIEDDGA